MMMGRTHDLAAFTALNLVVITETPEPFSLASGFVALVACMIGGLAPDVDQSTATFWRRIPAGSFFGRLIAPIWGGHRFISHSLLGVVIAGVGVNFVLTRMASFVLVDMEVVWYSFMIGFISHLIADTFTREGVPWLFPSPLKFGIPPIEGLRVKTGGALEKYLIFPGLLILNGYLFWNYYYFYLDLAKKLF